jgi:hypothetical protein
MHNEARRRGGDSIDLTIPMKHSCPNKVKRRNRNNRTKVDMPAKAAKTAKEGEANVTFASFFKLQTWLI